MSSGFRIDVDFDSGTIIQDVSRASEKALYITAKQVEKDCNEYAPFVSGGLVNSSVIVGQGSEKAVVWNAPQARFLHEGVVMVGKTSNSPYAKKYERKIVTSRKLTYNTAHNSKAGKQWTLRAKKEKLLAWQKCYENALARNL